MTRNSLILIAAGGSAALLAAVFFFQALGWAPCHLCLLQRWPHAAAVAIGLVALIIPGRLLPVLGGLAALTTAGLGLYHSGVERHWWEGPASCTGAGGGLGDLSGGALLSIDGPALVLCDTFRPFFLGLTMANWNTIVSLVLVAVWIAAARRSPA